MAETPTTIELHERLADALEVEASLFGVKKTVVNAAVLMFHSAEAGAKQAAIRAANRMLRPEAPRGIPMEPTAEDERFLAYAEALLRPQPPVGKPRGQKSAG